MQPLLHQILLERLRTERTTPVIIKAIPLAAMKVAVHAGCTKWYPPPRAGNWHVMPSGTRDGSPLISPSSRASGGWEATIWQKKSGFRSPVQ
jgi:hypothetical protein